MCKTITIDLKDYGELIGEDYSFGSATINITLKEYKHLIYLKNQEIESNKEKEKEKQFLTKFENTISSSSIRYEQKQELLNKFSELKNKDAFLNNLETLIDEIDSLRFITQKSNAYALLEYLK